METTAGFNRLVKRDASTADTLSLIVSTVNTYSQNEFVKQCAKKLCPAGSSRMQCLRNVFDYYCRNVRYLLDPPGMEKVYTPALTILEGAGDCKKASTFLAAVLKAAGIEPVLKHVTYAGNDQYSHIYVTVPDSNSPGRYIVLDPTNGCRFNDEVKYDGATLYFLNGKIMELRQMGKPTDADSWEVGCSSMMNDLDQISGSLPFSSSNLQLSPGAQAAANLNVPVHTAVLADALNIHPNDINSNRVAVKFKNIPFEQQRGAFLALVNRNAYGVATNLLSAWSIDPKKIEDFWKQFGGDPTTLKTAILAGAKLQPVSGPDYIQGPDYIGDIFEDLGRAISASVPIVTAATNVVTAIAPNSGFAKQMQTMATTANVSINKPIPGVIPTDTTGHKIPTSVLSGFFSLGGFVFKSIMLVGIWNLSPALSNFLVSTILTAAAVYFCVKKFKHARL